MSLTSFESLRKWEMPGLVRAEAGPGGLKRLAITTSLAQAQVYLHGAHVTSYQPVGHSPMLFTSERSLYQDGKAIRGGVPVIFPWFGANADRKDLPMHGFARTREWELENVTKWPDETIEVLLRLISDYATRALWPYDFVLRHRIIIGRQLEMRLEVENWSADAFTFEEALHTYLAVRDARQAAVTGLEGAEYLDKTEGMARKTQAGAIKIERETDRIYVNTTSLCSVDDAAAGRRLNVAKSGSNTTVVWNPWIEKAAALPDFGDEEWPGMLCIETANVAPDTVTLQPRESHTMTATLSVER